MKRNQYLRVKIKSLADEAKTIRREERIANEARDYSTQNRLHNHRTGPVRRAARETLLAYQYLRGIPYAACESENSRPVNWKAVERMCKEYGGVALDHEEWVKGAQLKAA
jgi:hypothetical protein